MNENVLSSPAYWTYMRVKCMYSKKTKLKNITEFYLKIANSGIY